MPLTVAKRELLDKYERTGRDVLLDYAQVVDKYLTECLQTRRRVHMRTLVKKFIEVGYILI